MTEAGDRLIEGAKEALAVAKGEHPAMRLHIDGWTYVPEAVLIQEVNDAKHHAGLKFDMLAAKAKNLVALLDDAEVNHGGLWSGKTMRARDELRQELARWR